MFRILFLIFTFCLTNLSLAAANNCEGSAMQRATANYIAAAGPIQGSDGPQVFIEHRLASKKPFLNYIVGIYDNNEDGETWTVFYFVMTKIENNNCSVLKVAPTEEAALKINSYYDFDNGDDLDSPKDFVLNKERIEELQLGFKLFIDPDATVCYLGDAQWVMSLVQSVLDYTTGDSAVLESNLKLKNGLIEHTGSYTEGSGDFDSSLDFSVSACK